MIVCVAEKPSVGRYIASVLGAREEHEGYIEGNGYQVTWTFGHLCGLLAPEEYCTQWKVWALGGLPIIPTHFSIKVTNEPGIIKQFEIIKVLIGKATEVINCGDAGQEGELIQRWVYQKAECKVPVKRLWVNSLTEEAIKEGFKKLKDQSEYQHLYEAGAMRAIGDWLLGMNASRAYTLRYGQNRQILSVGRVQTPTLALIVNRQEEIEHFVSKTYWELKTKYRDTLFTAQLPAEEDEYAIPTKQYGDELMGKIQGQPFVVTKVEAKKGIESAPKLFDLTSLQVECNKKYGFSAEQVLNTAQTLYEKRVTTYPRVDTTYLSDDIYPKIPNILKNLQGIFPTIKPLLASPIRKSKKVFDNSKVTDHHAIIPTGAIPNGLSDVEQKVYTLIATRFIMAFYPDSEVRNTTVLGEVSGIVFKVTGKQILVPGWRVLLDKSTPTDEEQPQEDMKVLPAFRKGESGEHFPLLNEKNTTPPKYYTEATLLRAMETAGKMVQDEELREALKANGIGRPSTRASIIEKLLDRNYIVKEKKKNLKATEVGIKLIHTILTPLLISAELTGQWERKLRLIEAGEYDVKTFLDELKVMTTDVVSEVKSSPVGTLCPKCHKGIIIKGKNQYGCSRWKDGCDYRLPFNWREKK